MTRARLMVRMPVSLSLYDQIAGALQLRRRELDRSLAELAARPDSIERAASLVLDTLRSGRKIMIAGNGGSAAQAQHFAGELVGRFLRDRSPFAAIALTADTTILTALGNDYGFDGIFARQLRALGTAADVFVALSTSGESENLVRAAQTAQEIGMPVVALTGGTPSRLSRLADIAILAPVSDTPLVQELHMLIIHLVCSVVEGELAPEEPW